jgi:phasin
MFESAAIWRCTSYVALHNNWIYIRTVADPRPLAHPKCSANVQEKDMTENTIPEIPQAVREFAAKSIDQTRAAYTQLFDAARKTQESVKSMIPANPMVERLSDVQERAISFAKQNIDAGFSLASELSQASDLTEVLKIQSKFAQQQLQAYASQAKELMAAAK